MLASWTGRGVAALLAAAVAVAAGPTIGTAEAKSRSNRTTAYANSYRPRFASYSRRFSLRHWASVLQCVPFARENSGIELTGNAGNWWENAEGLYQRGAKPEVGSILNFRASGRMRMGHVAVVTNVLDSRHIEIDHANWSAPGRISRDIDVLDVSPDNDWTAVRVAMGSSEENFGSAYPTYGFIYDRPDTGLMLANAGVTPSTAAAHPSQDQIDANPPEEVAEAADDPAPRSYSHRHRTGRYHAGARLRPHGHYAVRTRSYRFADRSPLPTTHHRHHS